MDPTTAKYYRAVLFTDGLDMRPLPASLLELHAWAVKRHMALGLGGMLTKATAFSVALTWMSSTKDGWEFTRDNTQLGDLFSESADQAEAAASALSAEEWDTLPNESKVVVTLADRTTKTGEFLGRRGKYVDVRIDGDLKVFQTNKVKLEGA